MPEEEGLAFSARPRYKAGVTVTGVAAEMPKRRRDDAHTTEDGTANETLFFPEGVLLPNVNVGSIERAVTTFVRETDAKRGVPGNQPAPMSYTIRTEKDQTNVTPEIQGLYLHRLAMLAQDAAGITDTGDEQRGLGLFTAYLEVRIHVSDDVEVIHRLKLDPTRASQPSGPCKTDLECAVADSLPETNQWNLLGLLNLITQDFDPKMTLQIVVHITAPGSTAVWINDDGTVHTMSDFMAILKAVTKTQDVTAQDATHWKRVFLQGHASSGSLARKLLQGHVCTDGQLPLLCQLDALGSASLYTMLCGSENLRSKHEAILDDAGIQKFLSTIAELATSPSLDVVAVARALTIGLLKWASEFYAMCVNECMRAAGCIQIVQGYPGQKPDGDRHDDYFKYANEAVVRFGEFQKANEGTIEKCLQTTCDLKLTRGVNLEHATDADLKEAHLSLRRFAAKQRVSTSPYKRPSMEDVIMHFLEDIRDGKTRHHVIASPSNTVPSSPTGGPWPDYDPSVAGPSSW